MADLTDRETAVFAHIAVDLRRWHEEHGDIDMLTAANEIDLAIGESHG